MTQMELKGKKGGIKVKHIADITRLRPAQTFSIPCLGFAAELSLCWSWADLRRTLSVEKDQFKMGYLCDNELDFSEELL